MKQFLRADFLTGLLTCFVVSALTLYLMADSGRFSPLYLGLTASLCFAYILVWTFSVREESENLSYTKKLLLLLLLFSIVIGIYFLSPFQFCAILMGVLCSMFAFYFPNRTGVILVLLASSPLYLVYEFYWEYSGAFVTAILFLTFNFFAYVMMRVVRNEQMAREEAENANMRLVSTQSMLEQAVKQSERVRIARNIHDLLGHHLTALTINLQVASRTSEGETKENIEQCHRLAKLLLSDVREAVSDIRDKSAIDLQDAIEKIRILVPELTLELAIDKDLKIDEIEIADTVVKCIQESITNTLKHAQGKHISICVNADEHNVHVNINNDGLMPSSFQPGNGLKGIKERVQDLHGKVSFNINNARFNTDISLPRMQYD